MYLECQSREFTYLMRLIRYIARGFTDINIPFGQQSSTVLREIKKEVLDHAPFFYNYEGAWPITAYLRLAMKSHRLPEATPISRSSRSAALTTASVRARAFAYNHAFVSVTPRRRGNTVLSYLTAEESAPETTENSECGGSEPKGSEYDITDIEGQHGQEDEVSVLLKKPELPDAPEAECSRSRVANRDVDNPSYAADYLARRRPSQGLLTPPPSQSLRISTSTLSSTFSIPSHFPSASSHTINTSSSTVSSPDHPPSILALLQSYSLPIPDAVHITGVLASLGISDTAHLLVLARMASRDAWLAELREKGRLTEIQVRVVHEMLERVVAEN
ncbi:hypothetical protein BV20DRAFT_1069650 [Pilatotrama ljubarskyi]|nr:hypothetical protein BV20DRAFT_1069650 [Pilatotrama ljubarskyi]